MADAFCRFRACGVAYDTKDTVLHKEISILEKIELARSGRPEYSEEILRYLSRFDRVILRGAGIFGAALGEHLLGLGIEAKRMVYWDLRHDELGSLHGVPVESPYSSGDPDSALIITCIPNGSVSGNSIEQEAERSGFRHILSGMALFEALMCPMNLEKGFEPKICVDTPFCNWCSCKKLTHILRSDVGRKSAVPIRDASLVFPVLTIVVNQKCTLACTHCGQYINHYGESERVNFPLERVLQDVDRILAAVDAVGFLSVIGGEPFLHPELGRILDHILTKPNVGVVGVTTNGVCKMDEALLLGLPKERVRLFFSDYRCSLDEKQKAVFERNIERVRRLGISHSVGRPLWLMPPSLKAGGKSEAQRIELRRGCASPDTCKTVQNGVFYPCSITAAVGTHGLNRFDKDWVALDQRSPAQIADDLRTLLAAPCYESCDYCGDGGIALDRPGEQGVGERYRHIVPVPTRRNG